MDGDQVRIVVEGPYHNKTGKLVGDGGSKGVCVIFPESSIIHPFRHGDVVIQTT